MENKTCGECKWYDHHHLLCVIGGDIKPTERAKDCFVSANLTNGDRIRHGGNKALLKYHNTHDCCVCAYYTTDKCCAMYCKKGMESWLNAPSGKDTNVPTKEREAKDE